MNETTNELIQKYNNTTEASNWLIEQCISTDTYSKTFKGLYTALTEKNNKRYGFTWKYDKNIEDLIGERWLDITTKIPEANHYLISDYGRIKNDKGILIEGSYSTQGYKYVRIGLQNNSLIPIHRLVSLLFIENPDDKPFVNHKNGKKDDNNITNLEWVTPSENVQHAHDTLLNPRGQRINVKNLTNDEETSYNSISETERKLNISNYIISKYLKSQKPYKNMLFSKAVTE
jgi:hypothetical protein